MTPLVRVRREQSSSLSDPTSSPNSGYFVLFRLQNRLAFLDGHSRTCPLGTRTYTGSMASSPDEPEAVQVLPRNTRKPASFRLGFSILLRGPDSNRGLEVLLFPYFRTRMDYPIFLSIRWWEFFIIVSEPSELKIQLGLAADCQIFPFLKHSRSPSRVTL